MYKTNINLHLYMWPTNSIAVETIQHEMGNCFGADVVWKTYQIFIGCSMTSVFLN